MPVRRTGGLAGGFLSAGNFPFAATDGPKVLGLNGEQARGVIVRL